MDSGSMGLGVLRADGKAGGEERKQEDLIMNSHTQPWEY